MFTENETNVRRVFNSGAGEGYFKDAFHEYVVHGAKECGESREQRAQRPRRSIVSTLRPGKARRCACACGPARPAADAFADFDQVFADRMREADEFYAGVHAGLDNEDARRVQRQALAGMLWNRQCYHYNVFDWLQGDPGPAASTQAAAGWPKSRLAAPQRR